MPLAAGTRIGPFEIVAPLGAGGMGVVYRARDTRLQRDVAIKVLPDALAENPERLARFEREARTLAALNHPNIAHIHGLEDRALVLELVEGDDLSTRIAAGPMPIDEAVSIARQVAEALDAAHTAGIVHRDLKPPNIKVRADGRVKVLDFGLAKALRSSDETLPVTVAGTRTPPPGSIDSGDAPGGGDSRGLTHADAVTLTRPPAMTQMGTILGTAHYMSPEQARGRAVDKRTDVWAFGCVFYEMLTGFQAFEGETLADVLGSILKTEPDWTRLPSSTPPGIERLLRRCLQKNPALRLRDMGDAVLDLDAAVADAAGAPAAGSGAALTGRARALRAAAWIASVIAAAALAAAIGYSRRPPPDRPLQRFEVAVQANDGAIREPMISPDGRRIAYVGRSRIWVQSLGEWKPRELPDTEAATRPFWSPDGEWIAYFRSEALLKVPASGGPAVRVCDLPAVQAPLGGNSGVWSEDGNITVSMSAGPLLRVHSGGGRAEVFGRLPQTEALDLREIELLPNGAILAAVHRGSGTDAVGVFENDSLRIVLEASNVAFPAYWRAPDGPGADAPGEFLLYQRAAPNPGLWAVRFSLERLETSGEPFLIGEGTDLSIAHDGTVAFLGQLESLARQVAWFSWDGRAGARIGEPREWAEGLSISPDGRRVLAAAIDGIWAYDVETGARSRITTDASDITPEWLGPDEIAFVRAPGGDPVLMRKRATPDGEELVIAARARFPRATADGRRLVFNLEMEDASGWQIAWIDVDRPGEIHRIGAPHLGARFPTVSPDGTLVAYVSGEVGHDEVFLTRFPSGEDKWQISSEGGGWSLFSPRGDQVLYRAPDSGFMLVPISPGDQVKIGPPRKLFDWGAGWLPWYDLSRDGKGGVVAVPVGNTDWVPSVSIVQNWDQGLGSR